MLYPIFYYLTAVGLLALLLYQCRPAAMHHRTARPSQSDAVFTGLALLLLILGRVPSLFFNRELNLDESQLLTQALTLVQDPVYGRSVDGTSIGPVNSYLLLIPYALGLPLDYTAARITGLLLIAGSIFFFYRSLLRLTSPLISRLSVLPALLFFTWTTEPNFLHYSSELSSLLILTVSFGLTLKLLQSPAPSVAGLVGLGALTGLVPYCKLQTLPIVGMMLITLTLYLFSTRRWRALGPLTWLATGFVLPTVVVFGLAYGFGVERYFIDYYFIGNLTTYTQIYAHVPLVSQGIGPKLLRFPAFLLHYSDFLIFIGVNCAVAVAAALLVRIWQRQPLATPPWTLLLAGLTALGALWSVITPGTEFGHHLLLLVFPLSWVLAVALQQLLPSVAHPAGRARLLTMATVVLVLNLLVTDNLLVPYLKRRADGPENNAGATGNNGRSDDLHHWLATRNAYLFLFPEKTTLPLSRVSQVIHRYASGRDQIAVWGWNCRYYVETGLAQGVSENHTQRSIIPNRMRAAYLSRYAHELLVNRPALFVDAVGKNSTILTKPAHRHEQFAGIDSVIRRQYQLVASVDEVRIYLRRDRLTAQRL